MKRIFAFLISLALLFSVSSVCAFAVSDTSAERLLAIKENVDEFLIGAGSEKDTASSVFLYNYSDEIEALFFQLNGGGYVVTSYKDGHIIEYSPDDLPISLVEIAKKQLVYYGGPLLFCVDTEGGLKNIITDEAVVNGEAYYSTEYKDTIPKLSSVAPSSANQIRETPLLSAPSNYVSASGGWYCTITGITNLLQYYKDNFSADVYSGSVSSVSGLRSALNTNSYIYNGPLYLSDAATSHTENGTTYLGLRRYLSRNDVTNYYVTVTSLTCTKVKTQIGTYSRPVLLMINTSSISSGATSTHIVLCYGYWETSMTTYYIVNNGWGSNSVYVCADDVPTSYEMLYLRQ